jgi:hypothetical protein
MRRILAWLALLVAALSPVACRDNDALFGDLSGQARDMASAGKDLASSDLAGSSIDMAGGEMPTSASTIHDLYAAATPDKSKVTVAKVVVTGTVYYQGKNAAKTKCEYAAFVQDATPQPGAPTAIKLFASGVAPDDMGNCPLAPAAKGQTPLDDLGKLGDVFTLSGTWSVYTPMGSKLTQHSITTSTVTKTGADAIIEPLIVTDGSAFAKEGMGYGANEWMLVTLQPLDPIVVGPQDVNHGFDGAGAHFAGTFWYAWNQAIGLKEGDAFLAITGIVNPAFGGGIAPRLGDDFEPVP